MTEGESKSWAGDGSHEENAEHWTKERLKTRVEGSGLHTRAFRSNDAEGRTSPQLFEIDWVTFGLGGQGGLTEGSKTATREAECLIVEAECA